MDNQCPGCRDGSLEECVTVPPAAADKASARRHEVVLSDGLLDVTATPRILVEHAARGYQYLAEGASHEVRGPRWEGPSARLWRGRRDNDAPLVCLVVAKV